MCGEEARMRAVEIRRDVAMKRVGELWQGREDESCDKKEMIEGES